MNRLDQFAALEAAATAGPWLQQHYSVYQGLDVLFRIDDGELNSTLHDAKLIADARNLAPHLIRLARTAQDCVEKLGYLEPANLTDTERHVMRQLRGALAELLKEVPDAHR